MAGARPARHAFHHPYAALFQLFHFVRIIGEQAHRTNAKRFQSFGGEFVIANVVRKTKPFVCFDRIESRVLQLVGLKLINQANAAAFLGQIQQHPRRFLGNFAQRKFELRPAVASLRSKDIPRKALRMDANQRRLFAARRTIDLSVLQRDCFLTGLSFDSEYPEIAESRRQGGPGDNLHGVALL